MPNAQETVTERYDFYTDYLLQGVVTFTLEELKGVPEDVISGYAKRTEDGKDVYDVTFKTPDIFPIVHFLLS